jgi:3-oxosteroid 1-dehydrogenase
MSRAGRGVADVLVIGSGAAGLVSACVSADLGLRTVVLEAERLVGGTSAISGGQMWLPGHHSSRQDQVRTYLDRVVMGATPDALINAFLVEAPRLAREEPAGGVVGSRDGGDGHPGGDGAA